MVHRFAVDKMLGRLATWLRIIGQDAAYGAHLSGETLLRQARSEGRVLLSRDRRFIRRRTDVPLLFIEHDHFREQLQQVVSAFGIDPFAEAFTRCARCNEPLAAVPREEITDRVPPYVLATQAHFVRCPRCHRIYWPATHHEHARKELQALGLGSRA